MGWALSAGHTLTCVACYALLTGITASAAADPLAQVSLHWQAPAPCPDVSALQARLRRDLAGSQLPSEQLDVQAIVTRNNVDDWEVSIHTAGAAGHSDRSLSGRSCEPLADATSLIIAMMIDPETAASHAHAIAGLSDSPGVSANEPVALPSVPLVTYPGRLSAPAPTPTQRVAVVSETKTIKQQPGFSTPPATVPSRVRTRGFASEWVVRDWGSLPSATEALGGSLGIAQGPWSGEASLGISLREDITRRPGPAIGSLRRLTGALRSCWRAWEHARVSVSPCAGFEWARWSSEGNSRLVNQRNEIVWTAAAEIRLVGALAVTDTLSLLLPLDVVLPLKRPSFGYTANAGEPIVVFEPAWIAFRIGAALQLYFP